MIDLGKMTGGLLDSGDKLKQFSTLNPQQQDAMRRLGDYLSSRIGQPMQQYGGQRVAGMSGPEQAAMGQLGAYMGGAGRFMPQRQAAYGQALRGQALAPIDTAQSARTFREQVVPGYERNFQRMAAPALDQARAMGALTSSSAMNRALAEQSSAMGQRLGDMEYQRMLQEEQAARQREELNAAYRQQAMTAAEPLRAEQAQMAALGQRLGQLPRMLEQASLDARFQEFLRTQPEYSPVLAQAMQYLGISTMGSYFQPQPGVLGQLTSASGQMADLVSNVQNLGRQPSVQNRQKEGGGGGDPQTLMGMLGGLGGFFGFGG